jgi:hypothetical protein
MNGDGIQYAFRGHDGFGYNQVVDVYQHCGSGPHDRIPGQMVEL